MTVTAGIDVGSSAVKCVVMRTGEGAEEILGSSMGRIRRREPRAVIRQVWTEALGSAGVSADDVRYVATSGEGELVDFRRGHFYGMTAHARGALFLDPRARAALDVGALHARAIRIDARGKVLGYRMTSQCASGSGQFLENIARYLGVTLDEVGTLSRTADRPEQVSGVCAVLAETDVINMASRGISTANILKGIHLSMAGRFAKLLAAARVEGPLVVTGGLAADDGLVAALREEIEAQGLGVEVIAHGLSTYAGAIGAAIWGAFRHGKLSQRQEAEA
ncbi:MAG TPA: benzoyl-CoA reductase subunit D [Candidatus Saccharimonadales bacterium]|nr:benzoyl-CoA reductase subunit D [Candidatus Saccharimonadales bacterium]